MNSKRVVFSIDERSFAILQGMTNRASFKTIADTVRVSLMITDALQKQSGLGFTEVVVRNPETGEEKIIVTPRLI